MSLEQEFSFGISQVLRFHYGDISLYRNRNTSLGTGVTPMEPSVENLGSVLMWKWGPQEPEGELEEMKSFNQKYFCTQI